MYHILVVDDEENIRQLIKKYANYEGYKVTEASDGLEALEICGQCSFDLIVLDVMMPELDGFSALRRLRQEDRRTPVLMLSARGEEYDRIRGFELGVDDYVVKPYRPAVLLAHLQALLRRTGSGTGDMVIRHQGVTLNIGAGTVTFQGRTAELTRNELRILQTLMRNPGIVVPRSEIMCALWESDAFIDDNTLTVNVNRLRKTLASLGVPEDFLTTRRGQGYTV